MSLLLVAWFADQHDATPFRRRQPDDRHQRRGGRRRISPAIGSPAADPQFSSADQVIARGLHDPRAPRSASDRHAVTGHAATTFAGHVESSTLGASAASSSEPIETPAPSEPDHVSGRRRVLGAVRRRGWHQAPDAHAGNGEPAGTNPAGRSPRPRRWTSSTHREPSPLASTAPDSSSAPDSTAESSTTINSSTTSTTTNSSTTSTTTSSSTTSSTSSTSTTSTTDPLGPGAKQLSG